MDPGSRGNQTEIAVRERILEKGTHLMSRLQQILFASIGVFIGSLLSNVLFGDGIQAEDVNQAAMIAVIAALIQAWLTRNRR